MAKAGNKTITWILLRDARALVVEAYQSPSTAERWLQEGNWAHPLALLENRWPHPIESDPWMNDATRLGDPQFWCPSVEVGGLRLWILSVNWQESSAHRNGMTGYTVSRIEVPREDVVALLPRALVPVSARGEPGKRWLEAEVKRREAAGDVPKSISDFSRELASKMAGVPGLSPLKARTIENRLRDWGLWPVK
jgi:hypothetical protein